MSAGFEVLVQLVMAAITTSPCWIAASRGRARQLRGMQQVRHASGTRWCGRRGPDSDGSIVARSTSSVSLYCGIALSPSHHSPCALA